MPKVLLVMEYVIDIERADSSFTPRNFTNEEFDQILAIMRVKRRQHQIPEMDGAPNPSISTQLIFDEGEEAEIEEMKRIQKEARERKKVIDNESIAEKRYKQFLKKA